MTNRLQTQNNHTTVDLPFWRYQSEYLREQVRKWMRSEGLHGHLVITQCSWMWTEGDHRPLALLSGSFRDQRFLADQRIEDMEWINELRATRPAADHSSPFTVCYLRFLLNPFTASILRQISCP